MSTTVEGFLVERRPLPAPFVAPDDELRERLIWREAAAQAWLTPEDIAAALETGDWPEDVARLVANDRAELGAHVNILLSLVGE